MNELHGHLIVDTTTGAPQDVRTLAAKLASQDSELVDATVVGSSEQARSAEATVIAGGSESAFQSALPLLKCFSQQQFHVGPSGSGATAKLIVNLVLGLNRAVLAEALNLTQQCGMNPKALLEILRSGAAYSKVMDIKGDKMVTQDFTPQARLDQHWKDVRLILDLGQATHSRLPLSELHAQLLERASSLGFGQLDNSAIIKAFENAPENDATT
jgi:3-hydroxyisobutyrate dehydrogenase-like beta-hydroxyacid dehydrogenase